LKELSDIPFFVLRSTKPSVLGGEQLIPSAMLPGKNEVGVTLIAGERGLGILR
jgi:hypothetical protein